jgi:hypothetical protein
MKLDFLWEVHRTDSHSRGLGQPSAEALPKLPLVAVVPDVRVLRSVATFYRLAKENEWFKKTL